MQEDDNGGTDGEETPDSAAEYIASLTGELAKLAKRNGLDTGVWAIIPVRSGSYGG